MSTFDPGGEIHVAAFTLRRRADSSLDPAFVHRIADLLFGYAQDCAGAEEYDPWTDGCDEPEYARAALGVARVINRSEQ